METLFSTRKWWPYSSSTYGAYTLEYEHRRNGSNMEYRFKWTVWLSSSGSWYYNALKMPIYLNGTNVETIQVKTYNSSEKGWSKSGTTGWYTVSNKTSGTVPVYFQIVDTGGYAQANWNVQDTSPTYNLYVDPAGSDLGTISDFTIGNAISIPITKYSSDFRDDLVIKYGSTTIKSVSGITNGASVSFTSSELNTIYSLMSTVKSGTFSFTITTYSGSTSVGSSSKNATGSITDANPTFPASKITYKDNNTTTSNVTQNNQYLVQNLSSLLVTIASATGNKGASITKYEATINGVTRTITSAGNIDFGVINSGSNLTLSVKVTDSRGNTTTATKTVMFLPWSLPTGIISLKRKNNYEDTTYLKVQASYSSINSKNTITIKYQYKKTTDSSYSSQTTISNNTQKTITLSKNYAWDFKITITDKFGTTTYNTVLAKGQFILFVDTKKLSVGVNCFPVNNESLEVNGKKVVNIDMVYPVGSIYMSVNATNPSTYFGGTWAQLKNHFLFATNATSGTKGNVGNGTGTSTGSTAITIEQMPSHTHIQNAHFHWVTSRMTNSGTENGSGFQITNRNGGSGSNNYYINSVGTNNAGYQSGQSVGALNTTATNQNTGGGAGHTHTIPYLEVYVWKRTA